MVMADRRQRLAWMVVLGSFFAFVALIVLVPLTVNAVIQRAVQPLAVLVQANEGTVGIQQANNGTSALFAGDEGQELNGGSTILTNATDTALLQVFTPDEQQVVARVQIYGNSNVGLVEGTSPRFGVSSADNRLVLDLNSGRLLVTVPPVGERPLLLHLTVPQGEITIREAGQYSLSTVNEESQFSVLQGQASVVGSEGDLVLVTDERVILPAEGALLGPLATERNLMRNGDFGRNFENWVLLPGNVERAGQSNVEVQVTTRASEPVIKFSRLGEGHADASILQTVDQDITDYQVLQVQIWMQIVEQSLPVCGGQGSECPLTIRIDYTDVNGVNQVWQQGFYAVGVVVDDVSPGLCVTCAPPLNDHFRVPFDQLVFYESDNLLAQLGQLNILPRHIKTVSIIAAGHTFDVEILEVAVMARE
jgi:hypothetical protein